MESSHKLKIALIKVRLMADIARAAQCRAHEFDLVMEMISDLAHRVLEEDETVMFTADRHSDEE
ncbi:MAG: hypothetical protein ACOH2G_06275 [Ewingella sp.]